MRVAIVVLLVASGCTVMAQPRVMADGRQGADIACRWVEQCRAKAAAICGDKRVDELDVTVERNGARMTIACKGAETAATE